MSLDHGGHLTHGYKLNFSGLDYEIASYGVEEDSGCIDYDKLAAQANEFKPKLIIAGASNYSRFIDFPRLQRLRKSVALCYWSTWRTFQALWPPGFTRRPSAMPTLLPPPPTKPCVGPAVA